MLSVGGENPSLTPIRQNSSKNEQFDVAERVGFVPSSKRASGALLDA